MSDLIKRLEIKASMIEMGEQIAWGSDSALMREAAHEIGMLRTASWQKEAQIENQRLNCEVAYRYAYVMRDIAIQRDARIDQLETAWRPPLTDLQIKELLPDFQNGWSVIDYGMWVARAVERAHGIGGGA